ncbi:MAG: hypothetical protein ACYTAF_12880 [Planctomycetota bacterium]|jgi:hypothetical protein
MILRQAVEEAQFVLEAIESPEEPSAWLKEMASNVYFYNGRKVFAGKDLTEWAGEPMRNHDLADHLEMLVELSELAVLPYHESAERLEDLRLARIENAPWYGDLARTLGSARLRQFLNEAAGETTLGLVRIGVELEQFRQREGRYPGSLDELGCALPLDPFTGAPFEYRPEGAGYVLSSTGPADERPDTRDQYTWRR